ncbi:MAG: hypothetical protein BWY91_02600 [bacterium ADurb.BinA028]|nr:MAG: hypothetical protein BWY91_02600 [bacterium ADurb.BinA028]
MTRAEKSTADSGSAPTPSPGPRSRCWWLAALIRMSGAPRSIWVLLETAKEVTVPSKGAVTVVTIFIDSRTATG